MVKTKRQGFTLKKTSIGKGSNYKQKKDTGNVKPKEIISKTNIKTTKLNDDKINVIERYNMKQLSISNKSIKLSSSGLDLFKPTDCCKDHSSFVDKFDAKHIHIHSQDSLSNIDNNNQVKTSINSNATKPIIPINTLQNNPFSLLCDDDNEYDNIFTYHFHLKTHLKSPEYIAFDFEKDTVKHVLDGNKQCSERSCTSDHTCTPEETQRWSNQFRGHGYRQSQRDHPRPMQALVVKRAEDRQVDSSSHVVLSSGCKVRGHSCGSGSLRRVRQAGQVDERVDPRAARQSARHTLSAYDKCSNGSWPQVNRPWPRAEADAHGISGAHQEGGRCQGVAGNPLPR